MHRVKVVLSLVLAFTVTSCGDRSSNEMQTERRVARIEEGPLECLISATGLNLNLVGEAYSNQRLLAESRCNRATGIGLMAHPPDVRSPWMLAGIREARTISIEGEGIESLRGLEQLESVGTLNLGFAYNESLKTLAELSSLREITRRFDLQSSSRIETLEGLENLERIGHLQLNGNDALRSLDALSSLREVKSIYITYNPKLPACEVEAFVDRFRDTAEQIVVHNNTGDGDCSGS